MSKTIRIPANLFTRLENHARGFDTPANVIERILDAYEGIPHQEMHSSSYDRENKAKDNTKYIFAGTKYGKGRLVLAVVKKYIHDNKAINYQQLLSVFPKSIQGSIGVINKFDDVQNKYAGKAHKRHFVKPDEIIQISDCEIAVCTEWGISNINKFLIVAKNLGYDVTPITE